MEHTDKDGKVWREIARERKRETVEDVVYVEQTIKKFNREGSENMETARIPEFVEREVEVDIVTYRCEETNETKEVRENEETISS